MPVLTAEREANARGAARAGTDHGAWKDSFVRDLFDTLDEARARASLYEVANHDNARVKWVLQHVEAATAFFNTARRLRARAEKFEVGRPERYELLRAVEGMEAELRALFGEWTI